MPWPTQVTIRSMSPEQASAGCWPTKCLGRRALLIPVNPLVDAGIVKAASFLDMTEEDFDEVVAVNLK